MRAGIFAGCFFIFVAHGRSDTCSDPAVRMSTEVKRLDGYETPPRHPEVYRDGFKISVEVARANRSGAEEVVVDGIFIDIGRFTPGKQPEYGQKKNLDLIYGAGPPVPMVFSVSLLGAKAAPARWIKKNSAVVAKSANLLDTGDPDFRAFPLSPAQPSKIEGTVLAYETGIYDVSLRIDLKRASKKAACNTRTIQVYQE